jgi:hypothetical protein
VATDHNQAMDRARNERVPQEGPVVATAHNQAMDRARNARVLQDQ